MNKIAPHIILLYIGVLFALTYRRDPAIKQPNLNIVKTYEQGVSDALMCEALLHLEQEIQRTNRTRLEMARIVCKRLGVNCLISLDK